MRERNRAQDYNVRMIRMPEGAARYGMGLNTFRRFARDIGATKKIGRMVLADCKVLDAYFDALPSEIQPEQADA